MTELVRAEFLKLKTVATTRWLMIAAVLLALADVALITMTAGPDDVVHLHDRDLLARCVEGAVVGEIIPLVLGVLVVSQELRFGTLTTTFLVTPARPRVVRAKVAGAALAGIVFAFAIVGATIPVVALVINMRGGTPRFVGDVVEVVIATVYVMAIFGVIGLGLGALVRNHIAAIVGAVAWLLIVDQLLLKLVPTVGRWTPLGATAGVVRMGRVATTREALLPAWLAALVLAGYAIILVAAGSRSLTRADIRTSE